MWLPREKYIPIVRHPFKLSYLGTKWATPDGPEALITITIHLRSRVIRDLPSATEEELEAAVAVAVRQLSKRMQKIFIEAGR